MYKNFDAEGDSGLVARTYGTCVLIERQKPASGSSNRRSAEESDLESGASAAFSRGDGSEAHYAGQETSISGRKNTRYMMSEAAAVAAAAAARHRDSPKDEVQLLTLRAFDPSVRVRVGGLVTARSVKFLGNLASKLSDQETRDSWWTELRDEVSCRSRESSSMLESGSHSISGFLFFYQIRSHAKMLCCTHVIGYLEASTIHDDVAILSITGTAASVRGLPDSSKPQTLWNQWQGDGELVSDAPREPRKTRKARREDRMNRRMRRAIRGSKGKSNAGNTDDDVFQTLSPTGNGQLTEFVGRGEQPNIIRVRRARAW